MRNTTCITHSCGRPRPEHRFLCDHCLAELQRVLGDIPAVRAELDTTTVRLDRAAPAGPRRGSTTPLPYRPATSEVRDVLDNTVSTWARLLAEHTGRARTAFAQPVHVVAKYPDVQGIAGRELLERAWRHNRAIMRDPAVWLLRYSESLAMHPAADEALDELAYAVSEAYKAIDQHAAQALLGTCTRCDARLYGQPGEDLVVCPECDTLHNGRVMRDRMLTDMTHRRVTVTTAQSWIQILTGRELNARTFRSWIARGNLAPAGLDIKGHQTYVFGEIWSIAEHRLERTAAA